MFKKVGRRGDREMGIRPGEFLCRQSPRYRRNGNGWAALLRLSHSVALRAKWISAGDPRRRRPSRTATTTSRNTWKPHCRKHKKKLERSEERRLVGKMPPPSGSAATGYSLQRPERFPTFRARHLSVRTSGVRSFVKPSWKPAICRLPSCRAPI